MLRDKLVKGSVAQRKYNRLIAILKRVIKNLHRDCERELYNAVKDAKEMIEQCEKSKK